MGFFKEGLQALEKAFFRNKRRGDQGAETAQGEKGKYSLEELTITTFLTDGLKAPLRSDVSHIDIQNWITNFNQNSPENGLRARFDRTTRSIVFKKEEAMQTRDKQFSRS
jgi:hypothetical protein